MNIPEMLDDVGKVKHAVQLYIDGAAGNAELLENAFHADARMFGQIAGARRDFPIADFINGVRAANRTLTGENYRAEIVDITVTGDAGVVTLVEQDYRGCDFVNYFTLTKFGDDWKIVSKTFTCTGGEFT